MPPTVKSLDERLDGLADELDTLKTQLATLTTRLDSLTTTVGATQAQLVTVSGQLAVIATKLENIADLFKATNVRLDGAVEKLDGLLKAHAVLETKLAATEGRVHETTATVTTLADSHAAFKARSETTFGMMRWVGAFAATALLTVIGAAFAVVRTTTNLESALQQQQKSMDELKRDVAEIRSKQK